MVQFLHFPLGGVVAVGRISAFLKTGFTFFLHESCTEEVYGVGWTVAPPGAKVRTTLTVDQSQGSSLISTRTGAELGAEHLVEILVSLSELPRCSFAIYPMKIERQERNKR